MGSGRMLLVLLGSCCVLLGCLLTAASADIAADCATPIQKVSDCIPYVTDGTSTPSPVCCSSVLTLYDTKSVCLCYLVEQVYTNGSLVKSINMKKLLGLPTDCKIQGANATKCIAQLGLTPSSSGAAVFLPSPSSTVSNSSSSSTPATRPTTTTTASSPPNNGASVREPLSIGRLVLLAAVAILYVFPAGLTQAP